MQHSSHLLMIRPAQFGYNPETAVNNRFQLAGERIGTQARALAEFDAFTALLRQYQIDVTIVNDNTDPHTPDSVFPNNWISFHEDGTIVLYPMFAANRRKERKEHVLDAVRQKFIIRRTYDLSSYEQQAHFLEGTGSMVLDREHRIAYACLSPRTDALLLQKFCEEMQYRLLSFTAVDETGIPIYHTNVMMCVADRYAVVCLDALPDLQEKERLRHTLTASGKEIVTISYHQLNRFAGNMLQVYNERGEPFLVMSSQAWGSLTAAQQLQLHGYNRILHAPIHTIETNGGGSARCMMAEIFLPLKS